MNPSAFARYDTLRAEHRAVLVFLLQGVKRAENLFLRIDAGSFLPPTREHFVRVVMSVFVVMTITIRIVAFVFVMMLVVVMTITIRIVAFVIVVMLVVVFVAPMSVFIVRMTVFVVVMTIAIRIVAFVFVMVLVVVFVAPMSVFIVRMAVFVVVTITIWIVTFVFVVVLHRLYERVHFRLQGVLLLHRRQDSLAIQSRPRRRDNRRRRILFFEQRNCRSEFFRRAVIDVGKDNAARIFHLVVEEFPEVLHVHFAFCRVNYRAKSVEHAVLQARVFHGLDYVA